MSSYLAELHQQRKDRLKRISDAAMKQPSPQIAPKELPKPPIPERPKPKLNYFTMRKYICAYFGVTIDDFRSPQRFAKLVYPRQIYSYLVTELLSLSATRAGFFIGGRDHTTVLHGRKTIMKLLEDEDPRTVASIKELTTEFQTWEKGL